MTGVQFGTFKNIAHGKIGIGVVENVKSAPDKIKRIFILEEAIRKAILDTIDVCKKDGLPSEDAINISVSALMTVFHDFFIRLSRADTGADICLEIAQRLRDHHVMIEAEKDVK